MYVYVCNRTQSTVKISSIEGRRVPELIQVLGSQPAGDVSHKPGGRLPLLSARPAVTLATLKRAACLHRVAMGTLLLSRRSWSGPARLWREFSYKRTEPHSGGGSMNGDVSMGWVDPWVGSGQVRQNGPTADPVGVWKAMSRWVGLTHELGRVGSGHTKWTHG